jgi:hypothetical protein
MPIAHGRGVREERGGNKGKEQGGGREDGYLKKNLLHHADEKLSESVHTEVKLYFS